MAPPHEGSTFHQLFYALGYVLEELEVPRAGKGGAERPAETAAGAGTAGVRAAGVGAPAVRPPSAAAPQIDAELGAVAADWLLARLLRPRPVRWPRAVLAGVVGTGLANLAETLARPAGPRPDHPGRYGSGIAAAAAYAALVYPRLPGPPLARGLLFGALEAAAADDGALGVLRRLSPRLSLPLERLASPVPRATAVARLAFGLGLGLVYRDGGKRR